LPTPASRESVTLISRFVTRAVFAVGKRLSLPMIHRLGAVVGWISWQIGGSPKRLALDNIARCLPELDAAAQRRLARRSFDHHFQMMLESPLIWIGDADRVRALAVETRGAELVDQALAQGKGLIIAAIHLGSFEAGIIPMSERYTMTGLFKPTRHAAVDELSCQGRTRFGGKMVAIVRRNGKRAVGSDLLRALKRGETIYALPDRDPPRGQGVFAPYFGVTAHSPVLIPKLVQATGAKLLFCIGERLPDARGFRIHFIPAPPGYDSEDLTVAATAINAGIETCVRMFPEQYWWGYKRFKRQQTAVDM
jgi:KDO2-lipid IV(A) lauroyltransferase